MWEKYKHIWDVIKNKLGIKFQREPVCDTWKLKKDNLTAKLKTKSLGNEVTKGKMNYTWIACITIDSVHSAGVHSVYVWKKTTNRL